MKLALIGAGQRGMTYARYAFKTGTAQIAAVADTDEKRRRSAADEFGIPEKGVYESGEALLSRPKLADAVIIATMDKDHYRQTMSALDAGYDILLEKPISPDAGQCLRIAEKAAQTGGRVVVCHVLRYSPFFREIKSIIDSGKLGKVVDIQHSENVGNFHMAHSFVRGNWRNLASSSPIITQKSCHDMDLLTWYANSPCKSIASFGSLSFFVPQNAPPDSNARCRDCLYRNSCRFSCYLCYEPIRGEWPASAVTSDQSEKGLREALDFGPYGRCVFRCDNDVCDHQTACMEFKNGVTATFNLSAFTDRINRTIKIMCENAELRAHEGLNQIEIIPFSSNERNRSARRIIIPEASYGKHSGGDAGLMSDFLKLLNGEEEKCPSDIARSVESHLMASAAEEARVSGRTIHMDDYGREISRDMIK